MNSVVQTRRSPTTFFLLVFVISIPFWLLGFFSEQLIPKEIAINLPISALMFVCPLLAASILVYRESGFAGVKQLLMRAFDFKRIKAKVWYIPIFFLMPVMMVLEYGVIKAMGITIPDFQVPIETLVFYFLFFFVTGLSEEIGWLGYAIDPLQERWNALAAGLIVGIVGAVWHFIPFLQTGNTLTWVLWQCAFTVVNRVLTVWLYNNTSKSVVAASLFHAMYNLSFLVLLPVYGSYYDPMITFVFTGLMSAIVTFLWGYNTLAQYRYSN